MSWTKEVTIWCDYPGCVNWTNGDGNERSVAKARKQIESQGWGHANDVKSGFYRDLCPTHKATTPTPQEEAK